uniref:PACRG-like protein n=1 Tax=Hemiselmis andersenii TaxID=464988 RepID=A0A6T8I6F1_HEMAN|mmetsp:Transcript_20118/g.46352  ORF Transcript_20118/g.46352 Transcript_20118/m.46352 type:complete len:275 (+) Transcript_20118:211-1035(+)|eukprot:CAMPEP_0114131422 /NCGR_PEP_ID=MMETSP0043_2-20121206/12544_1 /TAXON_ID=464988 /ORGANISM="Hemiselmis andersenii, Strain CCMP644" /LENGTH=274 /DNA_ID=CAMNT_0001224851 /DNA_START=211 /DNA_END=1035 /DNA_ORIENTATION=+
MANIPHSDPFQLPRTSSSRAPLAPQSAARAHNASRTQSSSSLTATKASVAGRGRGGGAAPPAAPPKAETAAERRAKAWSEMPSKRINSIKCADPFASSAKQYKTKFAGVFHSGGVPARLHHGAVNVRLCWSKDPSTLDYDPLLVTSAEGLLETVHPYAYASRACFGELLAADGAREKTLPLVSRIVPSIRAALVSSDRSVFEGGVEAVRQLSEVVGEALNEHIHVLVVQMNRRSGDKELAPKILQAMQTFEEGGGQPAYKVIKSKVPTYCSIHV